MTYDRAVSNNLTNAVISFDSEALKRALDQATSSGIPVELIVKEGLGKGMEIVGESMKRESIFSL